MDKIGFVFVLAIKNLFANPRRTIISITSLIICMIAVLFLISFIKAIFWGVAEGTIRSKTGHLQISNRKLSEKRNENHFLYGVSEYKSIVKEVEEIAHVEVIAPRIVFSGLVGKSGRTTIYEGIGVVPEKEVVINSFEYIVDGNDLDPKVPQGGIVGNILGDSIGVKTGDNLLVLSSTAYGGINAINMILLGTKQSEISDYDRVMLKMPYNLATELVGTDIPSYLVILLTKTEHTGIVKTYIEKIIKDRNLEDIIVQDWKELNPEYEKVVSVYTRIFSYFSVILGLVVFLSISNLLMMSFFERLKELGVMGAIGIPRNTSYMIFIAEALVVALISCIFASLLHFIILNIINLFGISMPPPPGSNKGYTLSLHYDLVFSFLVSFIMIVVSLLSCITPIMKVRKLVIIDIIRK